MKKTVINRKKRPILVCVFFLIILSFVFGVIFYSSYQNDSKDSLLIFPFLLLLIPLSFLLIILLKLLPPLIFTDDGIKFDGIFYESDKITSCYISNGSYESSENGTVHTSSLMLKLKYNTKSIDLTFPLEIGQEELSNIFDKYKAEWEKRNHNKIIKQS